MFYTQIQIQVQKYTGLLLVVTDPHTFQLIFLILYCINVHKRCSRKVLITADQYEWAIQSWYEALSFPTSSLYLPLESNVRNDPYSAHKTLMNYIAIQYEPRESISVINPTCVQAIGLQCALCNSASFSQFCNCGFVLNLKHILVKL